MRKTVTCLGRVHTCIILSRRGHKTPICLTCRLQGERSSTSNQCYLSPTLSIPSIGSLRPLVLDPLLSLVSDKEKYSRESEATGPPPCALPSRVYTGARCASLDSQYRGRKRGNRPNLLMAWSNFGRD